MRHVCDQVQNGKIGQMHTIKTVARDAPRPPTSYLKISGGIFHDCAVHDLGTFEFSLNCTLINNLRISKVIGGY